MTNGTQPDIKPMKDCLNEVEDRLDQIARLKGEYMEACKEYRAEIADIYSDAKNKGVNTQAVKVLVKVRALNERIGAVQAMLDPDSDQDYKLYATAVEAWEATPLAKAATG